MSKAPLENMANLLRNVPREQLESLLARHKRFNYLKEVCRGKGYIEILPRMSGIKVLKLTKEVRELKQIKEALNPGGFIWEDIVIIAKKSKG